MTCIYCCTQNTRLGIPTSFIEETLHSGYSGGARAIAHWHALGRELGLRCALVVAVCVLAFFWHMSVAALLHPRLGL